MTQAATTAAIMIKQSAQTAQIVPILVKEQQYWQIMLIVVVAQMAQLKYV